MTYASRHGSTAEVAEAIATVLGEQGHRTDLRAARGVAGLGAYDAVVLGGALYMGRLHADARHFLVRHRDELARMPVAVFAMGPTDLEERHVAEARGELDRALHHVPEVRPLAVTVFGGVIDPAALHFPLNRMKPADARDWDAIRGWAAGLAAGLRDAGVAGHHAGS